MGVLAHENDDLEEAYIVLLSSIAEVPSEVAKAILKKCKGNVEEAVNALLDGNIDLETLQSDSGTSFRPFPDPFWPHSVQDDVDYDDIYEEPDSRRR